MKEVGCVIDYPKQILWIDDTEVPIQVVGEEPRCFRVVLDKTVRIAPFTEMVIPAKIEGSCDSSRWGITGPPGLAGRNGDLMVGRTLVDLSKDYVPVRIANLSRGRKKL